MRAAGQDELELAVRVPVERRGRMILARRRREAVEHRRDERAQARFAGLVRAVDHDEVVVGETLELELGERAVGADADAVDLHGATSASSASATVSSSSARSLRDVRAAGERIAAVLAGQRRRRELVEQALLGRGAAGDLERRAEQVGLATVLVEIERRAQVLAAQLGAQRAERERQLLGRGRALLGIAQRERERRAPAQVDAHDELLARSSRLRRLQRHHRLAREAGEARGRDVRHPQPLEAHRRQRHELDLGPPAGVDLDDECALRAGLADVVRREAARVPGGRLLCASPDARARGRAPSRRSRGRVLGGARRIALARAARAVDLRVQHGDRGRARSLRQQLGEVGALGRTGVAHRDDVPERRARVVGELDDDRLVRQGERAAGLRERRERASRVVVAARDHDGRAGPRTRASCAST